MKLKPCPVKLKPEFYGITSIDSPLMVYKPGNRSLYCGAVETLEGDYLTFSLDPIPEGYVVLPAEKAQEQIKQAQFEHYCKDPQVIDLEHYNFLWGELGSKRFSTNDAELFCLSELITFELHQVVVELRMKDQPSAYYSLIRPIKDFNPMTLINEVKQFHDQPSECPETD